MKRIISLLLTALLSFTAFYIPAMARDEAKLILPCDGEIIYTPSQLRVEGELPPSCHEAKIFIDGEEKAILEEETTHFVENIDSSDLNYGAHTVTLWADGEEITRRINLTSVAADERRGSNYTGDSGATSSNYGGWQGGWKSDLTVNSNSGFTIEKITDGSSVIGRKYQKHSGGYVRITLNNNRTAEKIDSGVVLVNMDFSVSGSVAGFVVGAKDRGGEGEDYFTDGIVSNDGNSNLFIDGSHFETEREYHLTVALDIDRAVRSYIVDNKTLLHNEAIANPRADGINHLYFELPAQSSDDANITINNLTLNTVERMPYICTIGDNDNIFDSQISAGAEYVDIGLSDVADASSASVLLKSENSEVSATVSSPDAKTIRITPADGFEPGAVYTAEISDLMCSFTENNTNYNVTYPKPIVASFRTVAAFEIISPSDGEVFEERNVNIRVSVPQGYTDTEITLNGKIIDDMTKITSGGSSVYALTVSYEEVKLGSHCLKATAVGEDGEKVTLTSGFEVAAYVSEYKEDYPIIDINAWKPTVITKCQGSDGSENGAFRITADNASPYYYVNNSSGDTNKFTFGKKVVFEADFMRDENREISVYARGLQGGEDFSRGTFTSKRCLVSSDGKLSGTDITVPAGEWHNYRMVTDLEDKTYKLYYDRNLVAEGENKGTGPDTIPDVLTFVTVQTWCPDATGGICVDNVKLRNYVVNPRLIINTAVSATAKEFEVDLSEEFDALSEYDVRINGVRVKEVKQENSKLRITLYNSLEENRDCTLELSSGLMLGGVKIDRAICSYFKTDSSICGVKNLDLTVNGSVYNPGRGIKKGDELSASFTLANSTDTDLSATLIMVLYNGTRFVAMKHADCTVPAKTESAPGAELSLAVPQADGDYTVEYILIDSFKTRLALSKVRDFK